MHIDTKEIYVFIFHPLVLYRNLPPPPPFVIWRAQQQSPLPKFCTDDNLSIRPWTCWGDDHQVPTSVWIIIFKPKYSGGEGGGARHQGRIYVLKPCSQFSALLFICSKLSGYATLPCKLPAVLSKKIYWVKILNLVFILGMDCSALGQALPKSQTAPACSSSSKIQKRPHKQRSGQHTLARQFLYQDKKTGIFRHIP